MRQNKSRIIAIYSIARCPRLPGYIKISNWYDKTSDAHVIKTILVMVEFILRIQENDFYTM